MQARDAIHLARELRALHGDGALAFVDLRIRERLSAADMDGVAGWRRVAQAVRALKPLDGAETKRS